MFDPYQDFLTSFANAQQADTPGIGATVATTVHGIGGRSERVTGEVVGHRRNAVVVKTESHGRIVVTLDKIES
jgi:hypothetical protein